MKPRYPLALLLALQELSTSQGLLLKGLVHLPRLWQALAGIRWPCTVALPLPLWAVLDSSAASLLCPQQAPMLDLMCALD